MAPNSSMQWSPPPPCIAAFHVAPPQEASHPDELSPSSLSDKTVSFRSSAAATPCESIQVEPEQARRHDEDRWSEQLRPLNPRLERTTSQRAAELVTDKWFACIWTIVLVSVLSCAGVACTLIFVCLFPVWILAEAIFYVIRYRQYCHVSSTIIDPPLPDIATISILLDRVLAFAQHVHYAEFVGGWFLGLPLKELTREHVRQFISFGFYHRFFEELNGNYQEAVREHVIRTENAVGLHFPEELSSPAAAAAADEDCKFPLLATSHSLPARKVTSAAASAFAAAVAAVGAAAAAAGGGLDSDDETGSEAGLETASVFPCSQEQEAQAKAPAGDAAAAIAAAQRAAGSKAEKTRTGHPNVKFMAHTREPLKAILHPLILYTWGHFVGCLTALVMRFMGFSKHLSSNGFHYWVRQPLTSKKFSALQNDDSDEGVFFVHGLGIGITPYFSFMHMIGRTFAHKKFIVAELPHLAFQLSASSPTIHDIVEGMSQAMRAHGLRRATFIGHSYGTFVLSQYVRTHPQSVASLGLMDPVCFLLCIPKTIANMLYKAPGHLSDGLRWFFCAREMQVARSLSRNFDWHACMLWPEEMPRQQSVAMMAGADQIVPSHHIRTLLAEKGVDHIFNDGYQHAQVLFSDRRLREFLWRLVTARATAA